MLDFSSPFPYRLFSIMSTTAAINLTSIPLAFPISTAMHDDIDRLHKYINEECASVDGIPVFTPEKPPPVLFIPSGHFHIVAENITFRIHKYFFEQESSWYKNYEDSRAFESMTSKPPADPPRGRSYDDAVPLPVTAKQFTSMIWVIYNPYYRSHHTNYEEWTQIAIAADLLGFRYITQVANHKMRVLKIRGYGPKDVEEVEDDSPED